jgi:hypothetical protein
MKLEKSSSHWPRWALWALPVLLLVVAAKVLNPNPPVSAVETSPDADDAELKTRFYSASWSEGVSAAQRVLHQQRTYGRAWKMGRNSIAGAKPGEKLVETLRAHVPVVIFTDDLEVVLSEEDTNRIRVDVKSKSRIGRGDFGENRRHVVQFLAALDRKLES